MLRDIRFRSICEHHLLPFRGHAHIAYLPGEQVVGLGALPKLVDILASRPQVQERLGEQIADVIASSLDTRGVLVVLDASHECVTMRSGQQSDASTVTIAARGELSRALRARRADRADGGESRMSALIMGIVNVTPDSFSDGGLYLAADDAIAHGLRLRAEGAQLLDVGGESTRPGAQRVPVDVEQERVLPVVRALAEAGRARQHRHHERLDGRRRGRGRRADRQRRVGRHGRPRDARRRRRHVGRHRAQPLARDPPPTCTRRRSTRMSWPRSLAELGRAHRGRRGGRHPPARASSSTRASASASIGEQNWATLRGAAAHRRARAPRARRHESQAIPRRDPRSGCRMPASTAERRDLATAVTSVLAAQAGVWAVRVHDVAATRDALRVARQLGGREPMDEITLTGLRVFGRHGVYDEERRDRPGLRDRLHAAPRHPPRRRDAMTSPTPCTTARRRERVAEIVSGEPVDLLETLAARIADGAAGVPTRARARA